MISYLVEQVLIMIFASLVCVGPPVQQTGWATWYGDGWGHGATRADGEPFDPTEVGCAHRTLPLGSTVVVEAQSSGHAIMCEINDRGPYGAVGSDGEWCNRARDSECVGSYRGIIDLSLAAARKLWQTEGRPPNGDVLLRY